MKTTCRLYIKYKKNQEKKKRDNIRVVIYLKNTREE